MITKIDNRHIFAAYLNMARHNVFHVIGAICSRIGKEPINNDDDIFTNKIFDVLIENVKKEDEKKKTEDETSTQKRDEALKVVKYLRRFFPILEPIEPEFFYQNESESDFKEAKLFPSEYRDIFKMLFDNLKNLRNDFSHGEHPKNEFDPILIEYLKRIFDASVRATKTRKGYSSPEMTHLQRMKKEGKGRAAKVLPDPNFKYKFDTQDGYLNETGLAFFICLFLERKYAYEFLSQLKNFKNTKSAETQVTMEVFCHYHMRLPNQRIESDTDKNTLFMDMVNELSRCPGILYDQLEKKDRDRFKVEADHAGVIGYQTEIDPEVTLLRHEDRFSYFAMRYFDEQQALSKIRFMLDLGNYHFNVYKKTVSGIDRTRRLTQKLTTFGRIQDFSVQKTKDAYPGLVFNSVETGEDYDKPWIVETTPHYHFFEENLPIKIVEAGKPAPYPDISKDFKGSKNAPKKEAYRPDAYISKYEMMPFALFACLANQPTHNPAEILLIKYIERVKAFFKGIENGTVKPVSNEILPNFNSPYTTLKAPSDWKIIFENRKADLSKYLKSNFEGIEIDNIPKDLRDYLLGLQPNNHSIVAEKRLEDMISQTESRIRRLRKDRDTKDRKNKIGQKGHHAIKAGVLASFISKDLMLFQPTIDLNETNKQGKGKATGLTYQVLQASIAFYGANRQELRLLFEECKLLPNSPNPHPFLHLTGYDDCTGIVDFYAVYLEERLKYLHKCLRAKKYDTYFWLGKNKSRNRSANNYITGLAKAYQNLPINLPRGLFLDPIKNWMIQNGGENLKRNIESLNESKKGTNTVFLLQQYFQYTLSDDTQPFYDKWKRHYKIYDQYHARDRRPFEERQQKGLSLSERINQRKALEAWIKTLPEIDNKGDHQRASKTNGLDEMDHNEKNIRLQKAQDMVLFLLAKNLMQSATDPLVMQGNLAAMKLQEIAPDSEKGILSLPIRFKMSQTYTELTDGKKQPQSRKITKTIFQEEIKIKNYGDFRRFLKDRRLPNLMFYLKEESIARPVIEKELEAYDRARLEVFKHILDFETAFLKAYPEAGSYQGDGTEKSKHGLLLEFMTKKWPQYEALKPIMKNLRNAFCHNQFPEHRMFETLTGDRTRPIAEHFVKFASDIYGKLAAALTQQIK